MKNLTSLTALVMLLPVLMIGCTQEQPENQKATSGKDSKTNELVILNSDANALPSQEEGFSEKTKAELQKLREKAAILKAKAELDKAERDATIAAAANYTGVTADVLAFSQEEVEEPKDPSRSITKPMTTETFESNLKVIDQFGFLAKYSNKDELVSKMRSTFTNTVDAGSATATPEKAEAAIEEIESMLMKSGVSARDTNDVRKMLLDNIEP